MVGRIHAAGMTLDQLETEVSQRLKTYYRDPDLSINITQFKSQPVSVIGYVGTPGVIQLEGRKTLIEVLSQVGGLKQDAGSRIKITRQSEWGPIPLPSAKTQGDLSVAEVSVRGIETATSPEENIQILPNDIITVPRADIVYVLGEVKMPGGFALDERGRTISLIEVLARAGGATPTASLKSAKIVRAVPNANRVEIAVNLRDVTKGKTKDMVLQPDDILYVPNSYAKGAFRRTLDTIVNTATAVAIYRY
jgi:polysaccharide biosynthesis/export protein